MQDDKIARFKSSTLISPNPASTFAKVIYINENDPITETQVLTIDGKLLIQQNNSLPFFVNSFYNGIYIVKCKTSKGKILTGKLNISK